MAAITAAAEAKRPSNDTREDGQRPTQAMLVFVVPVYNEAENVPRLLADFERRPELFAGGGRLIVVDDGSTDATSELVSAHRGSTPLQLVRLDQNQGPGAAFRAGFAAALAGAGEETLVVTLEGDTTSDIDALPAMLERAADGAGLVLADWQMVNVGRVRQALSYGAGVVVRRALGLNARTVSSFFRVYRASVLQLGFDRYGDDFIRENGFACKAEILAKLTALGIRVDEVVVPLDWSRRLGTSKMPVLRTMVDYWRMLIRLRFSGAPS
jgi:dolichol-phosphate mannosyltransferase